MEVAFLKDTENSVKINKSPRFTAFTAKRCENYGVKLFFFHGISYKSSLPSLDPGWVRLHGSGRTIFAMLTMGRPISVGVHHGLTHKCYG